MKDEEPREIEIKGEKRRQEKAFTWFTQRKNELVLSNQKYLLMLSYYDWKLINTCLFILYVTWHCWYFRHPRDVTLILKVWLKTILGFLTFMTCQLNLKINRKLWWANSYSVRLYRCKVCFFGWSVFLWFGWRFQDVT